MSITHQVSLQDVSVSLDMHPEGNYMLTLKKGKEETSIQGNFKVPRVHVEKAKAKSVAKVEQKKPNKYLREYTDDQWVQYLKVLKEAADRHEKQSKWVTMTKAARHIETDVEESDVAAYDEWNKTYNGIEKNRWQRMKTFLELRNERRELRNERK